MVQFFIQVDSEIPASTQLFDQISFAITAGTYAAGHQLPSTRQLAQWTGLHRNTINKVYQQLKKIGLVEARGGSGIYVGAKQKSQTAALSEQAISQSIDKLLELGCSLTEARTLFNAQIDWRLSCSARLLVASGREDPGVAQIMAEELERSLHIPIQIVAIEDIPNILDYVSASTIITNRYFLEATKQAVGDRQIRVLALDIYDYSHEITRIRQLPANSSVGLVSVSTGILRLAESLIHSLRGQEILVITVLPQDTYRLQSVIRTTDLVIVGHSSEIVKIAIAKSDRIRPLEVIYAPNYIAAESVKLLKLELGID